MSTFTVVRTNHPAELVDARDLKQAVHMAVSQFSDIAEVRQS